MAHVPEVPHLRYARGTAPAYHRSRVTALATAAGSQFPGSHVVPCPGPSTLFPLVASFISHLARPFVPRPSFILACVLCLPPPSKPSTPPPPPPSFDLLCPVPSRLVSPSPSPDTRADLRLAAPAERPSIPAPAAHSQPSLRTSTSLTSPTLDPPKRRRSSQSVWRDAQLHSSTLPSSLPAPRF